VIHAESVAAKKSATVVMSRGYPKIISEPLAL
jgi:hypothetical protein